PYHVSTGELAGLLAQVEAVGAKPHFMFTGGGATLHPQLYDFFGTDDRRDYSFQLMTKGNRIQKKNAERLAKLAHLTKVQVSLESADAGINDSIYGTGLHRRVLKAVNVLRENDVQVTLAVTPMEINEDGLHAIEALAENKGAEVKYIS